MGALDLIKENIIQGEKKATVAAVEQALAEHIEPSIILNQAMIPAMSHVGMLFEQGEYFVPEMLISARCMQAGMKLLRPLLVKEAIQPIGKVAIGTVKGDLHDIGKNLVIMMLEGAGFEVVDLGVDTPPERFIQAVRDGAQIIAMSALLTTTMPAMKTTIESLADAGIRGSVKIMVGGAPLSEKFATEIGADGYGADANSAVRLAKSLLNIA